MPGTGYLTQTSQSSATVVLPATCGELVQGLFDGELCLVSCPIGWYGHTTVHLNPEGLWTLPPRTPKVARALAVAWQHLGYTVAGGVVRLAADIPRGRGYGSSTVDVAGTLYALGHALGKPFTSEDVARLAVRVEPTDSTLWPGLALFAHRTGTLARALAPAPPLQVVVVDPGGEVDTTTFNRTLSVDALRPLAAAHREAFDLLQWGLEHRAWEAVGAAATLSASVHQAILHNALLDTVLLLSREVGALGVCRAHSGTLLGILVDSTAQDVAEVVAWVQSRVPDGVTVRAFPLVGGGPRVQGPAEQIA